MTATPEPTDPAGVSEMADELQPVAWRWRYIRASGPDRWTVRQAPAFNYAGDQFCCPIEAEPLFAASQLAAFRAPPVLEVAKEALEAIHAACDEEIKVRFRTSSSKSEEELGRGSAIYSLLVVPRNIARAALQTIGAGQ